MVIMYSKYQWLTGTGSDISVLIAAGRRGALRGHFDRFDSNDSPGGL